MNRRGLLGTLAGATTAVLAGCSGDGEGTPPGTLVGDENGGGGDGGPVPTTEPPTTGAADVFQGVDYEVSEIEGGGTLTTWTVQNVSDLAWSVTAVSILEIERDDGTEVVEAAQEITLGPDEQTTVELRHDVGFDEWSNFRFEFRDFRRA
jgi:hypothetical protein